MMCSIPVFKLASISTLPSDLIFSFSSDNGKLLRVIHNDAFCPFDDNSPSVVTYVLYIILDCF